jgi:ADP-heptose:LPS heptosyltransferase
VLFEGVIERCKLAEKVNAYFLFSEWMNLNLPNNLLIPKQFAKQQMIDFSTEILNKWGIKINDFILMQIRASSPIRTPHPNFWKQIIDKLTDDGYKIILTDSPHQSKNIDNFIKFIKNPKQVFNFSQYSQSLDYSIGLISLCKMTIATDSSINHIAASLGKPCYGIFGAFPGEIRLSTYPKAKWVNAQKECSPCFIHSQQPCKYASHDGFSPCYNNINIDQLINEVKDIYHGE